MNRTSSISQRLIDDHIEEVRVSARHVVVENGHDHLHTLTRLDGPVSFRIKPDRRSIEMIMPAGQDRRRFS